MEADAGSSAGVDSSGLGTRNRGGASATGWRAPTSIAPVVLGWASGVSVMPSSLPMASGPYPGRTSAGAGLRVTGDRLTGSSRRPAVRTRPRSRQP